MARLPAYLPDGRNEPQRGRQKMADKQTELETLERKRAELWLVFEANGGRGVELAEEIDELDRQIAEAKDEL